jgi:hypothetical protein
MDLLRVATFVGGAVGGARCNLVLAVLESDSACLVCGTARAPDVRNGAARVDLQRAAALDVANARARVVAGAACMIASEEGCACSATATDLLQRVVADYGTKCGKFVARQPRCSRPAGEVGAKRQFRGPRHRLSHLV